MQGKFITFEGIDGSGKSTQLRMLAGALRASGTDVITTQEPGGTPLGRHLRAAFLDTEETVSPLAELLLFAADRAQHVEFLIRPALKEGWHVLSDRYADATVAYQGAGRGFDEGTIDDVISLATSGLKPDLTFYFDISVETAIQRTAERDRSEVKGNRMDLETAEFYGRVRQAYLKIAESEPARFKIIDASRSIEVIHAELMHQVTAFIGVA